MHARSLAVLSRLTAAVALAPIAVACGDDDGTPEDPLVGTWRASSFTAQGTNFIAGGMALTVALNNTGTYTITITNDLIGACEPGPNCTQNGNYTSTSTTVTLDPGTVDVITFTYTIQGTTMTWTGSIDNIPATVVFARQ